MTGSHRVGHRTRYDNGKKLAKEYVATIRAEHYIYFTSAQEGDELTERAKKEVRSQMPHVAVYLVESIEEVG